MDFETFIFLFLQCLKVLDFIDFFVDLWYIDVNKEGRFMVEKVIADKELIYKITKRRDSRLVIQYNLKNKRAWFQTDGMFRKKAIDINRVIFL